MRIIDYIIGILFFALIIAGFVSVQRHGTLTLGLGVLVVPLLLRMLIAHGAHGTEKRGRYLRLFDYCMIACWTAYLVLIIVFGSTPHNSHLGWPD